jgi:uncharacterized delta-60 repeat protein
MGHTTTLIGDHCSAHGVSLQNDGKIVVAGTTYAPSGNNNSTDIMIARYNENGSLDTTFDNDGIKVINLNYSQDINTLLIQNNGKIIVGGSFTSITNPNLSTIGLARFNIDGSLDTTFGTNGYVYTPNISSGGMSDMKFTGNEDIIAIGGRLMVKYSSNGQVINTFGTNGNGIVEETYTQLNKCVISSNNDIYISGSTYNDTKYNAFIVKARWGKMNIYQMINHCIASDDMITGKIQVKQMFLGRFFGKWVLKSVLKNNKPLKKNSPTVSELMIKEQAGDIALVKAEWMKRISKYRYFDTINFVHPFFGKMTKEQVGQFAYKHYDHHLRQFQV